MRTACFFWPGSEAKIAGFRPTYYLQFDNKIDDKARIEQVLRLAASAACRPAAFHHALLLRARPRRPRIWSRRAGDQGRRREGRRAGRQAERRARCDPPAHRSGGGERSRHGQSRRATGSRSTQFADLTGFETVGSLLYGEDRRGSRSRLQPAQESFVAVCRLSPQGRSGRARITARIRAKAIRW